MPKFLSFAILVAVVGLAAGCAREPEPVVVEPVAVEPEPTYSKI